MFLILTIFEANSNANDVNCEKQRWQINLPSKQDIAIITYILKMLAPETQRNNHK